VRSSVQSERTVQRERSTLQSPYARSSIDCRKEMNSIRLQLGLIEAEDLAIKKMRAGGRRAGGWALLIFGIGKAHAGMPGSRLVHPNSPFAMVWMVTSVHILLYSCLCSSYYVGFFWQTTLCDWMPPTLHLDMFVDLFFLLEIVLTFVTGVMIAGEYEDDMCKVASRYLLRGGFIIDLATSIPVSWVEWSLHARCNAMTASGDEVESGILRITRSSRVLRVLRLLRAFKFLSRLKPILEFVAFIGDYLGVPSYVLRVVKITMLIALLVHLCACAWWLIKTETNEPHVLNDWLEEKNLSLAPTQDLNGKYVIAVYFVNTVFCTIGFGDIHGSNDAERLYCVLLFYLGVFVFGSLLVEVQGVISEARHASREREHELREMLEYLRSEHVPQALARQMIQWYESHMRAAQRTEKRAKFIGMAPVNLKRKLAIALHHHAGGVPWQGGMLSTVPLFMRLDSVFREDLLLDLFAKMTPMVYCPHVSIATEGFGQSCLYVICSGCVTVQHNEMVLATLHRGDSFGEDWLLLDAKDPRSEQAPNSLSASPVLAPMHAEHKEHMRYVAVNEVLCMCLSSADFNPVVKTYDESVRAFFAVERARKKLEAKRKSLAAAKGYLDDSDSDGEGSPKVC
jgi:hypothetical protein